MKLSVTDLASLGILACAIALTGLHIRREFFRRPVETSPTFKIGMRPDVKLVGRVIGDGSAPIPMIVFADFQCPYCARAQQMIRETLQSDSERVKVLFRHLPLETIHPDAWKAALASECAADQGAFKAYHDLLYAKQDSIGLVSWSDLAVRSGVGNVAEFDSCLSEERHTGSIERDILIARDLGIDRTPTFVIGDEGYRGIPPASWVKKQVAKTSDR